MSEFKNTNYAPVFPNLFAPDHTQIERAPGTDDILAEARDYNILNTELIRTQQYVGLDPEGDWLPDNPAHIEDVRSHHGLQQPATG